MLIGVLAGGLGWLLGGGRRGVPADVELELPETTATTWSGRASNLWLAPSAVIPFGFAFVVDPIWSAVSVVVAVLVVTFAFVEVDADETRVAISLGPVGFPRRRYAIEDITGVGAIEVHPLAYGGWGWRIRSGRRSYVIRGGQAIRMERANGVGIFVTVDTAAEGAAVIDSAARARKYG